MNFPTTNGWIPGHKQSMQTLAKFALSESAMHQDDRVRPLLDGRCIRQRSAPDKAFREIGRHYPSCYPHLDALPWSTSGRSLTRLHVTRNRNLSGQNTHDTHAEPLR